MKRIGGEPYYGSILFDGGYVDMIGDAPVYMFFIKDHLGSVRAVVSETGEVLQTNEFYPYGDLFSSAGTADTNGNRYRFTGKELGDETGLYDFSARFLQTSLGRFTTIDPLAEKYPSISPYAYCNGNPVNFVDPDGMAPVFVLPFLPVLAEAATVAGAAVLTLWALDKMERKYESKKYNPGYEHQRGQDKRNKRALDKAQLNVQNSINNNYNNENDGPPATDPEKKTLSTLFLILDLVYETCVDPATQKPKEWVEKAMNKGTSNNSTPNSESVDSLKNEDSSDVYELPLEYL